KYGINFVKRGLRLNPNDVDLLFYLAHMYREKVAQKPEYEDFMERDMGVNNFEEAARTYKLARETGGELQTFHPRVVDSGVWHSYYQRILQILRRAQLDDRLDFPPDVLLRVEHFLDLCHKESPHLIEDYTDREGKPDTAFIMFPLREDLVLFDGYLQQARRTLDAGDFSDASFDEAGKIVDRAWDVLRRRVMKCDGGMLAAAVVSRLASDVPPVPGLYYFQLVKPVYSGVVQNKVSEGVSTIPWAVVNRVRTVPDTTANLLRALQLCRRALAMAQHAGESGYACRDQEELMNLLPFYIKAIEDELQTRMPRRPY
ncbi:MAG TPA: hypothetical protein VMY39_05430, partial [Planctomycetota bacterium]|nr:hypothetical protein [Planctomycetota bacterium]